MGIHVFAILADNYMEALGADKGDTMNITNLASKGATGAAVSAAVSNPAREGTPKATAKTEAPAVGGDTVTIGKEVEAADTYGDPRAKPITPSTDLKAMIEEGERKAQAIVNLILPLVQQQGLNLGKVVSGEQKISASPADIEAAKAAVAEDGELGVKQVANRILNFVKAGIGGDPAKLAQMRAAVEDGFQQAADMLGGTLPEISEKTRQVIMDTFDRWEAKGIGAPEEAPAPAESVGEDK